MTDEAHGGSLVAGMTSRSLASALCRMHTAGRSSQPWPAVSVCAAPPVAVRRSLASRCSRA
eukprot:5508952-Prymnesium_polylepis.1